MALPSIARRLAWTLLGSAVLWSLAVSAAVWLSVRHEVIELLDNTLKGAAAAMGPSLSGPLPALIPVSRASDEYAWQVVEYRPGNVPLLLLASPGAPAEPFAGTPAAGFSDRTHWRVFGSALGRDGRMLYVAQSQEEQDETLFGIVLGAALATLAVGLLAHLWLRARVNRELAPLERLSARLRGYDLLAPGASLGQAERAELQPIHRAIDELSVQLSRRLANERAFSAHAAHALRTPLAGIDAQLAVALREAPEALQPRLQRVRAAAGRLQRVVAALLALFRSGVEVRPEAVALATLLARLPVEGLEVEVPPDATVVADPDLLSGALLNLLDNALRHGARTVRVSVPAADAVRLDDDGPGVDPARRADLEAAVRAGDPEGHGGLGLVLAHLVAKAHGGALTLPAAPRGFAVQLQLGPTR
jgi:signal transduction histidine kinase